MKTIVFYVLWVVLALVVMFGFMYAARMFSNVATPITLHTPKPGVNCATIVTTDGAAISCWKD